MSDVVSDLMDFLGDDVVIEMPETEETVAVEEEVEMDDQAEEVEEAVEDEELEIDEDAEDDDIDEDDESDDELEDLDEDQDEDEDDDAPEEFELTLDGEVVKVTKEELTAGYLRNKDYLTKVAEAEERVAALKAEEETLIKSKEVFAFASLKQLAECEKAIEMEGGWLNIERTRDPKQVAQFKEMYQNIQNQAKLAESVQKEYEAKQEATYNQEMAAVANHLMKTVPGMSRETFNEIDAYVMDVGLTEDYLRGIRNPIAWTLIHKAMMYDKAQVRKVKEDVKQPKRVKKTVTTRKEQPVASGRRALDKKIGELKNTRSNKERNSELAVSAIADLLRLG